MAKALVGVDTYVNLYEDGVSYTTYIGDTDEPAVDDFVAWDEIVDNIIEAESIPLSGSIVVDFSKVDYLRTDGVQEILKVADSLRAAAEEIEERVRSSKIFLRHKWEAAGRPLESAEDFAVTYNEYLNEAMENLNEA